MISRDTARTRHSFKPLSIVIAAVLIGACQQAQQPPAQVQAKDEGLEWARAALQRNPNLELIATDANTKVFTVRDKQTGDVRAIKLNELAAAPIASLTAQQTAAAPVAPSPAASVEPTNAAQTAATSEPAAASEPAAMTARTRSEAPQEAASEYTIERSAGQVRVSGPGVSIVSAGNASTRDADITHSNAAEPIICEGKRMVHLDNRQIYVEGDAITVRGGCEMYITNSRVIASGTGIVVRDGTVHVSNSHIEGVENSFDADSSAKVFVRASTFKGLPRRSELALVQDQGGNRWR